MPGYKFTNSENFSYRVEPGKCRFEVIGVEFGIQSGGKTNGSDNVDLKLAFYRDDKKIAQWTETLIFHESIYWKIDTFLKAANYLVDGKPPKEGAELNFEQSDMLGLCGYCMVEDNKFKNKAGVECVNSRVGQWLTDAEKLPKKQKDPW